MFGDREVRAKFLDLSEELGKLGVWVRMHYVYPYPHVADVIPLMAEGKILPYLDIPFQHASPQVLKNMRRPAHGEKTLERIRGWREVCPDLAIRSTFIVGFPGETDDDFEMLLDWLDEAKIDRAGCFKYEPVKGARSNDLGLDQVPAGDQGSTLAPLHAAPAEDFGDAASPEKVGKRLPVHHRRGAWHVGEGPHQIRCARNRRLGAYPIAAAAARRRHRHRQDRPCRRLRSLRFGGLTVRSNREGAARRPLRSICRAAYCGSLSSTPFT